MTKVFIDTSAFLALINKNDKFYQEAKNIRDKLIKEKVLFVTTEQVIIELANSLSKLRFRNTAVNIINLIINSKDIKVIWTNKDILNNAFELYEKANDKEWGLTDCISFVVMRNEKIKDVFSADLHFQQAGFNKLL